MRRSGKTRKFSDLCYENRILLEKNNIIRSSEYQGTELKMVSFVLVTLKIGFTSSMFHFSDQDNILDLLYDVVISYFKLEDN